MDKDHDAANETHSPNDDARAAVRVWIGVFGLPREGMFDGIGDAAFATNLKIHRCNISRLGFPSRTQILISGREIG